MAKTFTFEEASTPSATPFDAALLAEGVTGAAADVARSIYQQESGSGKNTKTSNAGAVGGMQVMPGTFKEVAGEGWDINDPVHNARAGIRYVQKMSDLAGGDPALTAAGYYGGPGGLEKARKGIAVSDPRNPNAPNTLQYGQQVAARVPKGPVANMLDKVTDALIPSASAQEVPSEKPKSAPVTFSFEEAMQGAPTETATPATPATPAKRSMVDELGRQLGLTLRAGVSGVAALPAMVSDAVTGPINAGLDAVAGEGRGFRFQSAGAALNNIMTKSGVAEPENATERVVQDIGASMAGAGSMIKAGVGLAKAPINTARKGLGDMLAAGPGLQVVSSATGAGASGITRESGGGAGAQLAAGLAGGVLPSAASFARDSSIRGLIRGGEQGRQRVADTLDSFEKAANTTPTVGQATGTRAMQAVETGLSNTIGSSGVMIRRGEAQALALDDSVRKLSEALAPNASGVEAGGAITSGVLAFRDNMKTTQQRLYSQLDNHIPAGTRITADKTQSALADLNTDIAGAPELSKWFKNARIQGIEGGLKSDTGSLDAVLSRPGMQQQVDQMRAQMEAEATKITALNAERRTLGMVNMENVNTPEQIGEKINEFLGKQVDSRMPYESVKKLRTLVGRELTDNSLASDVPRSKWRALYAALSDDLGSAAQQAGPKAEQVWTRANRYTKLSMERMDQLEKIVNRDTPEKIFKAATSNLAEGGTTIRRVMQSLPLDNRREVTAAVLQRLGKAKNGMQNEVSDVFSSETFLTNLAAMSPAARKAIFDSSGYPGLGAKILQMGRMASVRREGAQVFANPSGTARQTAMLGWASTLFGGLASGNAAVISGALAAPFAANVIAKKFTSPEFVRGLAQKTELTKAVTPIIANMAAQANGQIGREQPQNAGEFSFEDAQAADSQQQQPPVRLEMNGMAQPDPTDASDGGSDPVLEQPAITTPQAVDDEELAQAFTSSPRPDGTLAISGDAGALRSMLASSGIPERSMAPINGGLLIGRSQAGRVQEAIDRMQAPPETVAGVDSGQPDEQGAGAVAQAPAVDLMAPGPGVGGPLQDAQAAAPVQPGTEQGTQQEFASNQPLAGDLLAQAATDSGVNSITPGTTWAAFPSGSGSLGVPREAMPQIKADQHAALVDFLRDRGVGAQQGEIDPGALKPTQAEFSPEKVDKATAFASDSKPILISSDGHVVDGHHQWLSKLQSGDPVSAIQLGAPIQDLLPMVGEFPGATQAAGGLQAGSGGEQVAQAQPSEVMASQGTPQRAGTLQPEAMSSPATRIQRLRDSGEIRVADILQRRQTLDDARAELASMQAAGPDMAHLASSDFTRNYKQQRLAGVKPAEASAHAGMVTAMQTVAPQFGMPDTAIKALAAKMQDVPIDEAPGFVERFTQGLIKRGVISPFDGSDKIADLLEQARDSAMNGALDSLYPEQAGAMA